MLKCIKDLIDKAFLGGEWCVGIRHVGDDTYLVQNENNTDYWIADPFLYCRENKYYLFCEKYMRKKDKGTIGVFEINNDLTFKDLGIAIEEGYHLSYPHIFEIGEKTFMIPESSGAKTVDLYVCEQFPLKWKKIKNLLSDVYAVDSNTFLSNEKRYLITYIYKNATPYLSLYEFDDLSLSLDLIKEIEYTSNIGRGAGNVFVKKGIMIRPTQNQKVKYGESLIFNEMILNSPDYTEKIIGEITVDDVKVIGKNVYKRIHTYNLLDDIEVIDLRSEIYDYSLIIKKIKRRFYNKGH